MVLPDILHQLTLFQDVIILIGTMLFSYLLRIRFSGLSNIESKLISQMLLSTIVGLIRVVYQITHKRNPEVSDQMHDLHYYTHKIKEKIKSGKITVG